jgi:hypothetical protein
MIVNLRAEEGVSEWTLESATRTHCGLAGYSSRCRKNSAYTQALWRRLLVTDVIEERVGNV